jgi:DNA-binding NarL/FixJ family response regulator
MWQMERRLAVGVLESQPMMIEGLRATLNASGRYSLLEPAQSLEALTRQMTVESPQIVIVDKSCGTPVLLEWLGRVQDRTPGQPVVWGNALTDAEALRFLKAGARGVIRKTAGTDALLACLDAVAAGGTWMEDILFQGAVRPGHQLRSDLTPREQQVVELVEQGLRNKDIARELGIQPGTVKIHLKHIFEKTGVRGRFGLAISGLRQRGDLVDRLAS